MLQKEAWRTLKVEKAKVSGGSDMCDGDVCDGGSDVCDGDGDGYVCEGW